jgi:hypothetical protein
MSLRGFTRTRPSPLEVEQDAPAPAPAVVVVPPDFLLAGVIGSQLSEPLAVISHVLDEFTRTRGITGTQIKQLRSSLAVARSVAMQSQQIARLAGGRLRQSHERLKLDVLLRDALHDRAKLFQKRGVELYQRFTPVEVIVDPGLLSSLIDAALDWATSMGRRLVVTLEIKNWPEHGLLYLKASESFAVGGEGRVDGDTLGWYLLCEIARAMGVSVERAGGEGGETSVLLEFPRTVKQLEGLTAVEVDTGGDSVNDSRPMAGHRLLVITGDDTLYAEVKLLARNLGLVVDFVPTTWQGVRFCELDTPHMVIIDERVRDHIFDELRADLKKTDPNYPFVEIAHKSNTLEIAGWMSDSITRLSRDALRSQLPSILSVELAKIM